MESVELYTITLINSASCLTSINTCTRLFIPHSALSLPRCVVVWGCFAAMHPTRGGLAKHDGHCTVYAPTSTLQRVACSPGIESHRTHLRNHACFCVLVRTCRRKRRRHQLDTSQQRSNTNSIKSAALSTSFWRPRWSLSPPLSLSLSPYAGRWTRVQYHRPAGC